MRSLRFAYLAAALAAAGVCPSAFGQTGGGGGAGGGTGGGGGATGGTGGGGTTSTATGTFNPTGNFNPATTNGGAATPTSAVDQSNFLRNTFANPYYPGRPSQATASSSGSSSTTNVMPGGFGIPSFGQTATAATASATATAGVAPSNLKGSTFAGALVQPQSNRQVTHVATVAFPYRRVEGSALGGEFARCSTARRRSATRAASRSSSRASP